MKLSKKLTMTIISQLLTAVVLTLNAWLKLDLSDAVQLALVGQSAGAIVTYLAAQGMVDGKEAENKPDGSIAVHGASEVHDPDPDDETMRIKKRSSSNG